MPRLFFGQAGLLGSTMGNASEFAQVLEAIGRGLRPQVDSSFALEEAVSALEHLDRAEHFGKVVLRV
jgi:NADPH:quinone reductase-like Zn-dependent oxidoreductase